MPAFPLITSDEAQLIFKGVDFRDLTHAFIFSNSSAMPDSGREKFFSIHPEMIRVNDGLFNNPGGNILFPLVSVAWVADTVTFTCGCDYNGLKLCEHQAQVLYNIMERPDLRIFFDREMRHEKIIAVAKNYGLENEAGPDDHFDLTWNNREVIITPKKKTLLPVNAVSMQQIASELLPDSDIGISKKLPATNVLVFSSHRFYHHLQVGLHEIIPGNAGKIKKLLPAIDPMELAWRSNQADTVKFYTGISAFANNHNKTPTAADLQSLKAIVQNPGAHPVFFHDTEVSDNITAASLVPVGLKLLQDGLELQVYLKENFYEISGQWVIGDKTYPLNHLPLKYGYFILSNNILHLPASLELVKVTGYFKKHNNIIVLHKSKFEDFRKTILAKLEDSIRVHYSWLVTATKEQLTESGFDSPPQPLIYLLEAGLHITISPVMRYGEVEVSILSKKQLYARDQKDRAFIVDRDEAAETAFTALLLQQHPDFEEQLHQQSFYLTKKEFLEDAWFLDAFETWRTHGIKIFGFNEIEKNRINAHKGKVSVKVTSGVDWFNTDLAVRFGNRAARLRKIHKALKNGDKYIELDDGTLGILPQEWIKKMAAYFEAGEIAGEEIRTPRVNYAAVLELYEQEMLSEEVQALIQNYSDKVDGFESIETVDSPEGLNAVLRTYQQQGLNWLNFMDDFNFGGCLADDMGLGKTIQVIAFILLLQKKHGHSTHLVVAPVSVIFNWEEEIKKFAPSLKVLINTGIGRAKNNHSFSKFDVVLTSYNGLVSDIHLYKAFAFNYVFLDESQAIKNPDSQRYRAACLLQAKNRIVLTGTPIENNTFDLYGQLSFACPGLLGNRQYFRDIYAQPIDKFGDPKRAMALQRKIDPFILRRTKKQVATELPEKTEMTIYCEMGTEQRAVYDAYEKEFRNYLLHLPEGDLQRQSMHVLQGLTKLRQICNSPALLKDQAYYGDASAKIEVLIEQIESRHQQHKILVFSQFVGMLDLVKKELVKKGISFGWLTGQTRDRATVVNAFQEDKSIRVLLISLKAGGTGLNLTEADYVYLVDPWWNPSVENQAIDRCYRIGQEKHVVAVRLICPETIEEKVMKLQASKKELVSNLIRTDTGILKRVTKEELIDLVKGGFSAGEKKV